MQEAFFQLLRLAGLLEALPLPPRSPQADMVAASISQRATLQEREVRFLSPYLLHRLITSENVSALFFQADLSLSKSRLPFCAPPRHAERVYAGDIHDIWEDGAQYSRPGG